MDPALLQRLVTFHTYFFGFLILDRQSFFGDPPSTTETFVMALVLALAVTLLSPMVANWLGRRTGGGTSREKAARGLSPGQVNRDRMARDPIATDIGV